MFTTYILQAGYQKWQIIGTGDKDKFEMKKEVNKIFKEEMGLLLAVPKPGNGTTKDRNTERRSFGSLNKLILQQALMRI
jgi:hypothetical protein